MSDNQYVNSKAWTWKCKICNQNFRTRQLLSIHKRESHTKQELKSLYSTANKKGTYYCQYCNKKSTTKSGNTNHEKYCSRNPNKIAAPSHSISEEIRHKISIKQSENCKGRIGWNGVLGRSISSYAEIYFEEILKNNGIQFSKNLHIDKYWLDYAFPEKMIYFEVDGEQHYTDIGIAHDQEREIKLKELGWTCISRIRWSLFTKLAIEDKEVVITKLLSAISTAEILDLDYKDLLHKKEPKYINSDLIKNGQVNSLGVPMKNMNTTEEWERRKNLILNSSVDRSTYGWKSKVGRETGLTKKQLENTLKHFPNIF